MVEKIFNFQLLLSLICFLFFTNFDKTVALSGEDHKNLMSKIFDSYESGVRPNYGGEPVKVTVSLYVLAMTNINERDMTFTVSMYVRQRWNDTRLSFDNPDGKGISTLLLSSYDVSKIWEPDTFVVNEVTSFQHYAFVPNQFVRISSKGEILKSVRYTVTMLCQMDLQYFPFDQQLCTMELESYGFQMKDVYYAWGEDGRDVGLSEDISTPTHSVIGHRTKKIEVSLSTGNYSRLAVEFLIARAHGRYITRFCMPMALFVLVSLLSLWIGNDRVAVVINFINICVINLFMAAGSPELPSISYRTSLDTYFTLCIFHVVFCLLDSLLANFFAVPSRENPQLEMTSGHRVSLGADDIETLVGQDHRHHLTQPRNLKQQFGQLFNLVNLFVKIGLFGIFILSNFIFFAVSSSAGKLSLDDYVPLKF